MLNKVGGIIRQDSGVGFYRQVQPLRFLQRNKLVKESRITPFSGNHAFGENKEAILPINEEVKKLVMGNADVIWTTVVVNPDELTRILDYRMHFKSKLVVDMDDNLYAVSRDNPGEKASKMLKKNFEVCLRAADGITVSVPSLAKLYGNLNKEVFIKKNGLDFSILDNLEVKKEKHKKIRIGWRGAYGHKADLEMLYPAIKALMKDYDIEFAVLGVSPKDGIKEPDFPVKWVDWTALCDEKDKKPIYPYYEKLKSLNLDIAVVPLIDSSYNRCKSNLQVLEMSAMKYPVVASPVENQKNMPILYASGNFEWYRELEKLIKDKNLRVKQAEEQYKFAKDNFNEKDLVKPLAKWFEKLNRRTELDI